MKWIIVQDGRKDVSAQLTELTRIQGHKIGRIVPLHTDHGNTGAVLLVELDPLSNDTADELNDLTDTLSDAALELRKELDRITFELQSIKDALLDV